MRDAQWVCQGPQSLLHLGVWYEREIDLWRERFEGLIAVCGMAGCLSMQDTSKCVSRALCTAVQRSVRAVKAPALALCMPLRVPWLPHTHAPALGG